jgi:hypothetical protein
MKNSLWKVTDTKEINVSYSNICFIQSIAVEKFGIFDFRVQKFKA